MNVAIIGFGYWGENIARNLIQINNFNLHSVCDLNEERLLFANSLYPKVLFFSDYNKVLENHEIDVIIVATTVYSHFDIAYSSLLANKHVLLEKPMTTTSAQAEILLTLSKQKNKILMIDHTYLYTSAVQKIKELIKNGVLGEPKYFDSVRVNLGKYQSDINVLWDLAVHDIVICDYLFGIMPLTVQAIGVSHSQNNIENIGYLSMKYENDFIAHFHCSWSAPFKIRHLVIGGDNNVIFYNDLEPKDKLKVYKTTSHFNNNELEQNNDEYFIPSILDSNNEALYHLLNDFFYSISENKVPKSSAEMGVRVVKILEAAQYSIKNNGFEVKI